MNLRQQLLAIAVILLATSSAQAAKPPARQDIYSGPIPGTEFWCSVTARNGAGEVLLERFRISADDGPLAGGTPGVTVRYEQVETLHGDNYFLTHAFCNLSWTGAPDDIRAEICSDLGACSALR